MRATDRKKMQRNARMSAELYKISEVKPFTQMYCKWQLKDKLGMPGTIRKIKGLLSYCNVFSGWNLAKHISHETSRNLHDPLVGTDAPGRGEAAFASRLYGKNYFLTKNEDACFSFRNNSLIALSTVFAFLLCAWCSLWYQCCICFLFCSCRFPLCTWSADRGRWKCPWKPQEVSGHMQGSATVGPLTNSRTYSWLGNLKFLRLLFCVFWCFFWKTSRICLADVQKFLKSSWECRGSFPDTCWECHGWRKKQIRVVFSIFFQMCWLFDRCLIFLVCLYCSDSFFIFPDLLSFPSMFKHLNKRWKSIVRIFIYVWTYVS